MNMRLRSALLSLCFNEYGVQIMTPNYEGDRETPALVAKENWYASPADRFSEGEAETDDAKRTEEAATA